MKHIAALAVLALAGYAAATIVTKRIDYKQGDATLEGYLAYDDSLRGTRPGVLIVHDWNGIDGYEERRARELAQLGYVAFAADIYGKGVHPKTPQENGAQAGKYKNDLPTFRARLVAGLDTLKAQPQTDGSKLAAIGYCFGGTGVLELARTGADIRGIVAFHGGLDSTTNDATNIKAKVNLQCGALDRAASTDAIDKFKKEFDAAHVDYSVTLYAAAVHAFTVPEAGNDITKGAAYNALADKRSWAAMKDFFDEIFGK